MNKIFLVLIFLMSCSTKSPSQSVPEKGPNFATQREAFLGYWMGEMTLEDGKFMRWLVERRADGTFTLTHMIRSSSTDQTKFDPDKAKFELGTWGVSGDVYFTATRQYFENKKIGNFDVTDPGLYDAYKILAFDGQTMSYRALESGKEFSMKKVPKDSKLDL